MGQTEPGLAKGEYACSEHSLLISGDVIDIFVGRWEDRPKGRVLVKCGEDGVLSGGQPMCILRLRRPITIAEYRKLHHPMIRPLIKSPENKIEGVIMPTSMACTIPNTFPSNMEI